MTTLQLFEDSFCIMFQYFLLEAKPIEILIVSDFQSMRKLQIHLRNPRKVKLSLLLPCAVQSLATYVSSINSKISYLCHPAQVLWLPLFRNEKPFQQIVQNLCQLESIFVSPNSVLIVASSLENALHIRRVKCLAHNFF